VLKVRRIVNNLDLPLVTVIRLATTNEGLRAMIEIAVKNAVIVPTAIAASVIMSDLITIVNAMIDVLIEVSTLASERD